MESGNEIKEEPITMVMATEELLDTLSAACQYQNAGFSFASEHLSYICIYLFQPCLLTARITISPNSTRYSLPVIVTHIYVGVHL